MERLGDHAVSAARRVVYIVSGFDPSKEPLDDATMKQIVAEGDKRGLILGGVDDQEYADECYELVEQLGVRNLEFTGRVNVVEYSRSRADGRASGRHRRRNPTRPGRRARP